MQKAVFFSGVGTSYCCREQGKDELEVYPETLPALRFLARRGFIPVLVTPHRQEYKWFVSAIKDKSFPLLHWDTVEDFPEFNIKNQISLPESFLITDGLYLNTFQKYGLKIILVLSGRGFCTYNQCENGYSDVCKNIYAAAFSAALNSSL